MSDKKQKLKAEIVEKDGMAKEFMERVSTHVSIVCQDIANIALMCGRETTEKWLAGVNDIFQNTIDKYCQDTENLDPFHGLTEEIEKKKNKGQKE